MTVTMPSTGQDKEHSMQKITPFLWFDTQALNGGPEFTFTEAISLFVTAETQDEIDDLWEKITSGGTPGQCGWLKNKYGLSWQIVPPILGELLEDPDPNKSSRAMQAMLGMSKIDIAGLRAAFDSK